VLSRTAILRICKQYIVVDRVFASGSGQRDEFTG
jgi:hypothetical protein